MATGLLDLNASALCTQAVTLPPSCRCTPRQSKARSLAAPPTTAPTLLSNARQKAVHLGCHHFRSPILF